MMNWQKKLFLASMLAFMLGVGVFGAKAQDSNEIFTRARNTEKIAELKILYRNQIESYRNSQREFSVAKIHYSNVQTLVALEDAVGFTKLAMRVRSEVLITYLELLGATLEETAGVELDLKKKSLNQINSLIVTLQIHQEDIDLAQDRSAVNLLADKFEVFVDSYNQIVYKTLSLIRIGQIQAVYDVAFIIEMDIKKNQEGDEAGAVEEAKRSRAHQEIEKNFTVTNDGLAELNVKIIEGASDDDESFSRSFYEKTLRDLEPIYIQLLRSLDHLEELQKL